MANKSNKFNFNTSPAAQEINNDMQAVQDETNVIASAGAKDVTKSRTATADWTLVQSRMPNDIHLRMGMYGLKHRVPLGTIIQDAVREFLDRRGE